MSVIGKNQSFQKRIKSKKKTLTKLNIVDVLKKIYLIQIFVVKNGFGNNMIIL